MRRIPPVLPVMLMVGALAAPCFGQSYFYPSDSPTTGKCNVIPFGVTNLHAHWENQKYQCLATPADLGNRQVLEIMDIAFAPCGTGVQHFDSIEIVLAQTDATKLSTTFAQNLTTNPLTVLSATDYDWHIRADEWNRIAFDTTYQYIAPLGKNLVIQITVMGSHFPGVMGFHRHGSKQRVQAENWRGTPPAVATDTNDWALKFEINSKQADLHTFGTGCKGLFGVPALSFSGSAKLGSVFTSRVTNCIPNIPVLQIFSQSRLAASLDLQQAGAPGCAVYLSPDWYVFGNAAASGVFTLPIAMPNDPNLVYLRFYTQAFATDPTANTLGAAASNYGRILPGY